MPGLSTPRSASRIRCAGSARELADRLFERQQMVLAHVLAEDRAGTCRRRAGADARGRAGPVGAVPCESLSNETHGCDERQRDVRLGHAEHRDVA